MGHLVTNHNNDKEEDKPGGISAINNKRNTMSVCDRCSGRSLLIDCGADFSILPASSEDKKTLTKRTSDGCQRVVDQDMGEEESYPSPRQKARFLSGVSHSRHH